MRLSIYVKALQIPQLANWIYFSCKRFGVYAHYAKMYDIFLDRLTLCKDIDDNIEFWIKRQEKKYKEKLNNQKLNSLLMMPVQRLPRYILLLEELIKYTQRIEDGDDVGTILFLGLAKSEIQTVSSRVNEMVRQRENRSHLRELINRFTGDNKDKLLRSNRVLVYEGFLYKVRKYKIKYYFHLFSDIIVYSNINNNGLFNIHRIIDLHKTAIVDLPNVDENSQAKNNEKLSSKKKKDKSLSKKKNKKKNYKSKIWYRFLLKSQEKSFEILTENEQEKQNWMLLIKAAISRLKQVSVDHNKSPKTPQSVLSDGISQNGDNINKTPTITNISQMNDDDDYYAPYWMPDDASNNCCCCQSEFSVMNRRHHCRRCGNLVCKSCSKHKKLLSNIDKNKPVRICNDCYQLLSSQKPCIQQTKVNEQPLFIDYSTKGSSEEEGETEDSLNLNKTNKISPKKKQPFLYGRKAFSIDETVQQQIRKGSFDNNNNNNKKNGKTTKHKKKNSAMGKLRNRSKTTSKKSTKPLKKASESPSKKKKKKHGKSPTIPSVYKSFFFCFWFYIQ